MNAFGREVIRQQRAAFDQLRRQDRQWFTLRLTIGYCAVLLLLELLAISAFILLQAGSYPEFVVKAASASLFLYVGLLFGIWKLALGQRTPNGSAR